MVVEGRNSTFGYNVIILACHWLLKPAVCCCSIGAKVKYDVSLMMQANTHSRISCLHLVSGHL